MCDNKARKLIPCEQAPSGSPSARLCSGVRLILNATCDEIRSVLFVRGVLQRVGLSSRGLPGWPTAVYGSDAQYMIAGPNNTHPGSAYGIWQDPLQLATALMHVGSLVAAQPASGGVARYIEVGAFSGWTACVVSAYIRRRSAAAAFEGYAVDLNENQISSEARELMALLNLSFVSAAQLPSLLSTVQREAGIANTRDCSAACPAEVLSRGSGRRRCCEPSPFFSLCFIDGDHSFVGVARDYVKLSPLCQSIMFHDIADERVLAHGSQRGGGGAHKSTQKVHARPVTPLFPSGLLRISTS